MSDSGRDRIEGTVGDAPGRVKLAIGVPALVALLVLGGGAVGGEHPRASPPAVPERRAAGIGSPAAAGCAPTPPADDRAASPPPPAATPRAGGLRVGRWSVAVEGAATRQAVPAFGGMEALGSYLVVRLVVANGGDAPAAFPYDAVRATDRRGSAYAPDLAATDFHLRTDGPETVRGTRDPLPPGAATRTVLVFDVPSDAGGFTLSAEGGACAVPLAA